MSVRPAGPSAADRICAASFLVDFSHYLVFGALPFQAIRLGAGPFELGLLPSLYAATYAAASMLAGRLSDGVGRHSLVRAGILVFALAAAALGFAKSLGMLLLLVPATGAALGFFWSPAQAALSDAVEPARLGRALARFNVAWSAGKCAGFFAAGAITASSRPEFSVFAGIAPLVAALALLPRAVRVPREARRASAAARLPVAPLEDPSAPEHAPEPRFARSSRRFVLLAWGANAIAYGVSSTLNVHAPALLERRGGTALDFGVYLGLVFASQTASFAFAGHRPPSGGAIAASHALGFAALAIFLFAPGQLGLVISAALLGLALALAYEASLHASLHRDAGRGFAAGIHEAVLAAGSSLVPLVGGAVAASGGGAAAPFHVCLALLFAAAAWTGARERRPPAGTATDRRVSRKNEKGGEIPNRAASRDSAEKGFRPPGVDLVHWGAAESEPSRPTPRETSRDS